MVKLSTIYKAIVILCASIMVGVPLLFPTEFIGVYTQRTFIFILALGFSLYVLVSKDYLLRKQIKFLNYYAILYVPIILIMSIYSSTKYSYPLDQMLKITIIPHLFIFVSYLIIFIFHSDNSVNKFLKIIAILVVTMLSIRMFSWIMYNFRGSIYFPRLLFQYEGWIRDGFQRVEAGVLYGIALVTVAVNSLRSGIKGIIYKTILVFMVLFLVLVTRVRFQSFLAVITIGMVYVFYKPKTRNGSILKILFYIIAILFLLLNSQLLGNAFDTLLYSESYSSSTGVRFEGLRHYLSIMYNQNAIFGLGFLNPGNSIVHGLMSRNQWSIYYIDDLGIFGTIIQLGVFTFITHGLLFMKAVKVTMKSLRSRKREYILYTVGLTTYMIGSNLLLNMFDDQRIFDVPFYLAIYSYLDGVLMEELSDSKDRA
ncbi:hypothetical protein AB1I63_07475 [Streptococcus pneumoniae]